MTILDIPLLFRIRRNHGLEHATINILSLRFPYRRIMGYSFPDGFFILGEIPTADLREAVILRFYQDLSFKDISIISYASVSTVKMRVCRGLEQLKRLIAQ